MFGDLPWAVLVLLVTGLLAAWIPSLEGDFSNESYLRTGDPARVAYEQFRDQFDRDDRILIGLAPPEVFDLAVETGRRIGAIVRLRTEDLRLESTETEPFGSICWPASSDKCGKAWVAPLNPRARAAIDSALKKRQAIGPGHLFAAAKAVPAPWW